ncbi:MAG TPA: hypothetical protein VE990_12055 [Acidimicrobiales bacterium]|nr:hypothetical protein [Acidimicrobiales bacterium]
MTASLVEIRIVGLPLDIQQQAQEHFEGLLREFSHITASDAEGSHAVPKALVDLNDSLQAAFGGLGETQDADMEAAARRGDATIDLTYDVPAEVAPAANQLLELMAEADRYCSEGRYLLSLRSSPAVEAFRRWFLTEFVNQVAGHPPVSWADWSAQHLGRSEPA